MQPERRRTRQPRRGAVLVQFGMLSFAIMGIMTVAIDLGLARSVHGTMRNGAEAAALEGLRQRDAFRCPSGTLPDACALLRDLWRRLEARRALSLVFDEDLDLATRNIDIKLGMGGFLETGINNTGDLETTGLDETLDAYNPVAVGVLPFQLNEALNEAHGDMVAGDFQRPLVQTAGEDSNYDRPDFLNLAPLAAADADSFLVRTRRGTDPFGLDRVLGVSSSGPPIPILFGLGSLISKDPAERYDPRRDGFTVRSTAIATARPALAVGLADPGGAYGGCLPFAEVAGGSWTTLAFDAHLWEVCTGQVPGVDGLPLPDLFIVSPTGLVRRLSSSVIDPCQNPVLLAAVARLVTIEGTGGRIVEFGNSVAPVTSNFDSTEVLANGPQLIGRRFYQPVLRTFRAGEVGYDPGCSNTNDPDCYQVVGFGAFEVVDVFEPVSEPGVAIQVRRLGRIMAEENGTALLRSANARFANAGPYVRQAYDALAALPHVQAPVLAR